MGSHTPPEDLKARFQDAGRGYIHLDEIPVQALLVSAYLFFGDALRARTHLKRTNMTMFIYILR